MPETYQEAIEKVQEETDEEEEHLEGMPNYAHETEGPEEIAEAAEEALQEIRDAGDISVTPPDFLSGQETGRRRVSQPGTQDPRGQFGVDVDLDQLPNLGTPELLQIIARVNLAMLSTMLDISDYTSPLSDITVSGTNAIDDDDVPQPVVPQSDQTEIPTRFLMIKSDSDNTKPIAFGDDGSSPDSGFVLEPGQHIALQLDLRGEVFYMASEQQGQVVQLLGMV